MASCGGWHARYLIRERRDHSLAATALVHEAYLKLVDQRACAGRIARISLPWRRT